MKDPITQYSIYAASLLLSSIIVIGISKFLKKPRQRLFYYKFFTPIFIVTAFNTCVYATVYLWPHLVNTRSIFYETSILSIIIGLAFYLYYILRKPWLILLASISSVAILFSHDQKWVRETLVFINKYSITLGDFKLTPGIFFRALISITLVGWLTSIISKFFHEKVGESKKIKPSTKELLYKIFDVSIYIIAGVIILKSFGINLTTLTVVGGALGVGVGFGLQKITSNFISGIILLVERSLEVGDLIELDGGIFGYIKRQGPRFTLIETFDSQEIMVPNEDFITNRVINWTYSNKRARIQAIIGVSYKSDIHLAKELILKAAKEYEGTSPYPKPECYLTDFADSSVNFLLFFFIDDITKGRYGPKSDVMVRIWDLFKEHGIEIPFPQRDIHIIESKNPKEPRRK